MAIGNPVLKNEPEDFTVEIEGPRGMTIYEPVTFKGLSDSPPKFGVHVPYELLPQGVLSHIYRGKGLNGYWVKSHIRPPIIALDPEALANELRLLDALNRRRDDVLVGRHLEIGVRPFLIPDSMSRHMPERMPEDAIGLALLYVKILGG